LNPVINEVRDLEHKTQHTAADLVKSYCKLLFEVLENTSAV